MILRPRHVDATKGNIPFLLVVYAVPIILSTLVQSLFHTADMLVLARFADTGAYAAVGATSPITGLVVNSFFGLSIGVKILLVRFIGAREEKNAQQTVSTALLASFWLGVVIAVLGLLLSPALLRATDCPEECFAASLLYIRLYVAAAPAIMVYNFGASILRAAGDSERPLYYIIFSGILNMVLNVILCIVLSQKVAAVAIATVSSQILGAFLIIRRLCKMDGICHLNLRHMEWDFGKFVKIIIYGLPAALTNALFPLANLQIQSAINSFGVSAIAGNTAAITIEGVPAAFSGGFNASTTTFVGQNLGAGKKDRVKQSIFHNLWMSTAVTLVVGVALYLTGRFWLGILQPDDPVAIEYGMSRVFYITLFYFIAGFTTVISGSIQAFGYTLLNSISSLVTIFGFRIFWMSFIYPLFPTFNVLMQCFLVSWLLRLVIYLVIHCVIMHRYRKGFVRSL